MTQEEFKNYANDMLAEAYDVLSDKGSEYAQDANAFANFEHAALEAGITREQSWVVFFNKHVAAVNRSARGYALKSETLRGRCIDIINYAIFLSAMHDDDQRKMIVLPADNSGPPPSYWPSQGDTDPDKEQNRGWY